MEDLEGVVWEKSQDKLGPMLLFCFFYLFIFFPLGPFLRLCVQQFPWELVVHEGGNMQFCCKGAQARCDTARILK